MCRSEGLQLLTRLEPDGLARRDGHFFPGARVTANAGLAGPDAEDSEAAELDALATAHSVLQGFEDGLDGLFRLGARDSGVVDHGVDDIELDHTDLPRATASSRNGCSC